MTNSDKTTPPPMPDLTTTVGWFEHPDETLGGLASWADDKSGLSVPLTLYLPWGIATGHTVAQEGFYRLVEAAARRSDPPTPDSGEEFVDAIATGLFGRRAERARDWQAELDSLPDDERTDKEFHQGYELRRFIHLREVTTVVGGFSRRAAHLRVRLADISAWSFGAFTIGHGDD